MNEQWFYDAAEEHLFCKQLEARGAVWWRGYDRDLSVVRWIEYWQW